MVNWWWIGSDYFSYCAIGGAVVIVVTGGTATPAVVGGLSALGALVSV